MSHITIKKIRRFLKVYFWVFAPLLILGFIGEVVSGKRSKPEDYIDTVIMLIGIAAFCLYIYRKKWLAPKFWQLYFVASILWGVWYDFWQNNMTEEYGILISIIGLIVALPFYASIYLYAFGFLTGKENENVDEPTTIQNTLQQPFSTPTTRSSNKRKCLYFIIIPIAFIIITMMLWTLASFAMQSFSTDQSIKKVVNIITGFMGVIGILALIFGSIIGIIYFVKKELGEDAPYDERSGKGGASDIPPEIYGFNWGAFGLGWIWGVYHRVWISFLVMIPLVGIVIMIVLGIYGNEWAWRKNKWESVEAFKKCERRWIPWGIGAFILQLLAVLARLGVENK